MKKRMLSLLLILCMAVTLLPTAAFAAEDTIIGVSSTAEGQTEQGSSELEGADEQPETENQDAVPTPQEGEGKTPAANSVAKIGGTMYSTLADAVYSAKDEDTITLLEDCSEEVTISKKITLTAADDVTFKGTLTFSNGSVGSKVVNMTFDYNGSSANIITIESGASGTPGVTVGGCSFTLGKLSNIGQPNCIYIQDASDVNIVKNKFHLTRIADQSVVAINLSGAGTDNTTVSQNSFDVLTDGDNAGSLFFFKAMGEAKAVGESVNDYITGLNLTSNTINGSNAPEAVYFAGLSGVQDPVITGNQVTNYNYGIFHVTWTDSSNQKWGAANSVGNAIISGNTFSKMYGAVAEVAGTEYKTLAAAINAANGGDTVKLLKESTEAVTISREITLTAAEGVTFKGTLTFANGSAGSKVVDMTFDYSTAVENNRNIITINHGVSNVTVGGCSFTLGKLSNIGQPNCIYINNASSTKIVKNEFHLTKSESQWAVAINLSGKDTDNTEVSDNSFDVTGSDGPANLLFFLKAMGEAKTKEEKVDDYIEGLRITNNTIDGSGADTVASFAGIAGVKEPVITGNTVNDCYVGIAKVTWKDDKGTVYSPNNSLDGDTIISGNTYTGMTDENYITLAKAVRKHDDVWTDYDSVQNAVDAIQPGDTVVGRPTSADKAKDVTVTLKYNDGVSADAKIILIKDTSVNLPTPTRSGYTFNGWYNGSTKVDSASYTASESATLTASWSYIHTGGSSSDPTYAIEADKDIQNGEVTVSRRYAEAGDTVTITVKPDSGYVLGSLTVTDKNGDALKLTDKGDGKYTFTMPAGKVEITAAFTGNNPFTDVPAGSYYEDAVIWAVGKGITTGTSATTFSPDGICTRAQAVTFLWRAAGSPAPTSTAMPFTDVPAGSYYYSAVLWAIENGITKGTSDTTFSPDADCTRAQIVTFLYRYEQSQGKGFTGEWMFQLPFTDVPEWCYEAVAWCYMEKVTDGTTATTFSPNDDCTRAQIVTFLYRCMK